MRTSEPDSRAWRGADVLRRLARAHPLYVWLLWAGGAAALIGCPMLLSDPVMWPYLLDPELLALLVVIGARYTLLQIDLLHARIADSVRRGYRVAGKRIARS